MRKAKRYLRASALPAIAAALALSSTPLAAQEAQPVTTETPVPEQAAPSTVDTSSLPTADTSAPATKTVTHTVRHTTHVAAAKPAPAPAHATTHVTTTRSTAHATTSGPAAAPAAAPAPAPAATTNRPPPVVDMTAKPAQSPAPVAKPAAQFNNTTVIAGAAVLALLIIATAAFAIARSRRRRREEQEWADQQSLAYEPFETEPAHEAEIQEERPAMVAPEASAFAWGNEDAARERSTVAEQAEDDDRRAGETWVERAYRGPSPANPSVSLKARLKRAAFFDKRERDAAAGLAAPVDPGAGLPGGRAQEEERELA